MSFERRFRTFGGDPLAAATLIDISLYSNVSSGCDFRWRIGEQAFAAPGTVGAA